MKYRVLVTAPYFLPVVERFRRQFESLEIEPLVPAVHERLSESELLPLVHDIDGTICGDDEYSEVVLAQASRLRVISKWGTGIDSIDQDACRRRGVVVCNTPNAFTTPVADNTLGYVLLLVRRLQTQADEMRRGQWRKIPVRSVAECTIGLIGMGNIGREVAKRLASFGGRLLGTDPVPPPTDVLRATGLEVVDLVRLLHESDIVTLHCDLNPTSFQILNRAAIAQMRPGACVINTARGRLIEEAALVDALLEGRLAGAALDVFETEPLAVESPLRTMANVFLASHNANSSPRAWEHVHTQTVDNLVRHLTRRS